MDGGMDEWMENLPATAQLQLENIIKQGKGTADHMPLGNWLILVSMTFSWCFLAVQPNHVILIPLLLSLSSLAEGDIGNEFFNEQNVTCIVALKPLLKNQIRLTPKNAKSLKLSG